MRKTTGSVLILILGLLLALRVGTNVVNLYKAGGRLSEQEERLVQLKKENQELTEKLAMVKTPEYMEREAREKLGMGKEGEIVVVIPQEELKVNVDQQQQIEKEEPNWKKWRKLYLGW